MSIIWLSGLAKISSGAKNSTWQQNNLQIFLSLVFENFDKFVAISHQENSPQRRHWLQI
jgi:hypothetical protein